MRQHRRVHQRRQPADGSGGRAAGGDRPEMMALQSGPVSLVAMVLGGLAMAFGVLLTGLTLAGAVHGYAAIGFYDITIGGMFVAFGLRAITFGHAVVTGRLTVTGQVLSAPASG